MESVLSGIISNLGLVPPPKQQHDHSNTTNAATATARTPPNTNSSSGHSATPTPPNSFTTISSNSSSYNNNNNGCLVGGSHHLILSGQSPVGANNNNILFNFGSSQSHQQQIMASPSSTSDEQQQQHHHQMLQQIAPAQQQHQFHQQQQKHNATNSSQQQRTSRTYFRPPGKGPGGDDPSEYPANAMVCPECGFSCSSKFHYNSHMNTHKTQLCPMCTYQARTEGRLRKHIQESHTHEQRVAAGIAISPRQSSNNNNSNNNVSVTTTTMAHSTALQHSPSKTTIDDGKCVMMSRCVDTGITGGGGNGDSSGVVDINNCPTSIAPLLNSMLNMSEHSASNGALFGLESLHSMLNNSNGMNTMAQFHNPTDAILKICTDAIANNGPNEKAFSSPQMGDLGPMDHLRALAERQAANLLATSTANALGLVGTSDLQIGQDGTVLVGGQADNSVGNEPKQDTPRRAGKPKRYKCKQCEHVSRSKEENWQHSKLHIPKQKQLTCELCDFVTEYKHHLEYHYRNHNGQKPFKCSTCAYTCVNKSMLNSHMKSHTPVFQFRCQDCTYQTKYCHSLKMHLKKYNHKRAPGLGGSESSDSHGEGEERQENASSSSVGKEDSFEHPDGIGQCNDLAKNEEELATMMEQQQQEHKQLQQPQQNAGSVNGTFDAANVVATTHPLLLATATAAQQQQQQQQQIVDTEMEQRFLLQQQLEQMNELIRNPVVNCPYCEFSADLDEMNKHLLFHLIMTHHQQQQLPPPLTNEQQALMSIYQRVTAHLQQEMASSTADATPPLLSAALHPDSSATTTTTSTLLAVQQQKRNSNGHNNNNNRAGADVPMEVEKACQMERNAVENIRQQQQHQNSAFSMTKFAQQQQRQQSLSVSQPVVLPQQQQQHFVSSSIAAALLSISSTNSNNCGGGNPADCCTTTTTNVAEPCRPSSSLLLQSCSSGDSSSTPTAGIVPFVTTKKEFPTTPQHQQPSPFVSQFQMQSSNSAAISDQHGRQQQRNVTGTCLINKNAIGATAPPSHSQQFHQQQQNNRNNAAAAVLPVTSDGAFAAPNLHNNHASVQGHADKLPFYCHHCDIGFKDYVLYQLHRGYHSIETPLKCNRCGHLSATSLEFNLHLYQAKHE